MIDESDKYGFFIFSFYLQIFYPIIKNLHMSKISIGNYDDKLVINSQCSIVLIILIR